MPDYLGRVWIDWSWPHLDDRERALARRHEALLQSDPHSNTYQSLFDLLTAASRDLPTRTLRARYETTANNDTAADTDDDDSDDPPLILKVLSAHDGRCQDADPSTFDESGQFEGSLTPDDYREAGVTRVAVTLFWRESALNGLLEQARRLDRSASWTMQRAWILSQSAPATIYPTVQAQLTEGRHRRQWLYMPLDMFTEVRTLAARHDHSMSKIISDALARAWPFLCKLIPTD